MSYERLESHFAKIGRLQEVEAILEWDQAVNMPDAAGESRAEALATLSVTWHEWLSEPAISDWVERAQSEDLGPWQRANLEEMRRLSSRARAVPLDLVEARSRANSRSEQVWRGLRQKNDFASYAPYLKEVVARTRDAASLLGDVLGLSPYDALVDGIPLEEVTQASPEVEGLFVVPATIDLAGAEIELVSVVAREHRLRRAIERHIADLPADQRPHYVLIDCPPSLGLLTLNTLAAADTVLIPIQCEFYALEGLSQLLNTVRIVQKNLNPALEIEGVLLTMFDSRLNLSRQVAEEAKEYFGPRVYRTTIPRNVRIAEAPLSAYDILDKLRDDGLRAPLQVYRALEKRCKCSGCVPNVVDIITEATKEYHREGAGGPPDAEGQVVQDGGEGVGVGGLGHKRNTPDFRRLIGVACA